MTTKTRLVEALTRDLEEQFKGSDKTAPFNAEGNLKYELSRLLKKEFDNSLDESESMLLDAYKNAFEYYAKYRVDSEWELDVHTSVAHEGWHCEDIEEARRLMSGEEELEEPDYSSVARNLDFDFGDLLEKSIAVEVDWIEIKTNCVVTE